MSEAAAVSSLTIERSRRVETSLDLGAWLARLRETTGLSQVEAARAIGVEERSIRRWENEGQVPNGLDFLKAMQAYGVRLSSAPPLEMPAAVNAELAEMRMTLEEIRDGVSLMKSGSMLGRTQVLLRLAETAEPAQLAELREPLLALAQREREAGRLLMEQADLLEQRLS